MMHLHQAGMTFDLPKGKAVKKAETPMDLEAATMYVGGYDDPEIGGTVRVIIKGDRLALDIPGQPVAIELYNEPEEHLFSLVVNSSIKVRFDVDEDGRVVSYTAILPDGTELMRPRIEEEAPADGGESDAD
jgi:hypothetical protein